MSIENLSLASPAVPEHTYWFYAFALPGGQMIDGLRTLITLRAEADIVFATDLNGKTVLDIGAQDGYSRLRRRKLRRRARVATDRFCFSALGRGTRRSRLHARHIGIQRRKSRCRRALARSGNIGAIRHLAVPRRPVSRQGPLFLPGGRRTYVCSGYLVIETVTALPLETLLAMRLYRPGELGGDPTNFWAPNLAALQLMLQTFDFRKWRRFASPAYLVIRSVGTPLPLLTKVDNNAAHRTIVHAWR